MGKPYADDLRMVAIRLIEEGHTRPEVAELCGISLSSVGRYLRRFRATGSVSPEKFGGYKGYALAKHAERIKRWIAEQPDLTLVETQARLAKSVLWGAARALGFLHDAVVLSDDAGPFTLGRHTLCWVYVERLMP